MGAHIWRCGDVSAKANNDDWAEFRFKDGRFDILWVCVSLSRHTALAIQVQEVSALFFNFSPETHETKLNFEFRSFQTRAARESVVALRYCLGGNGHCTHVHIDAQFLTCTAIVHTLCSIGACHWAKVG